TQAMRAAMAAAEVGDDVFGEDPTVNRLEEMTAEMFGKEAALFVASGTQANLLALMSHCQRGDEYIAGQDAHCYKYEGAERPCWGAYSRNPWKSSPTAHLTWHGWPAPSSPAITILPARGCSAWRTPRAARCFRSITWPEPAPLPRNGASPPIWTEHASSMPQSSRGSRYRRYPGTSIPFPSACQRGWGPRSARSSAAAANWWRKPTA